MLSSFGYKYRLFCNIARAKWLDGMITDARVLAGAIALVFMGALSSR